MTEKSASHSVSLFRHVVARIGTMRWIAVAALALLAVLAAPAQANDNFPGTTITGASGTLTASNATATGQTGEPASIGGGNLNSMWYSWTATATGTVTFQTCGGSTNFDTTLQAFTGTAVNALTTLASNDDSCSLQSLISFSVTSGTTYRIQVDGYGSNTGTFTLAWSLVAATGADLSLTKSVSNASPTNGAAISYTLTVTNAAGSPQTATGIQVTDVLPAGFVYTGASGTGSYDSATGVWSVGTLAPGGSASITLSGTVNATQGATVTNSAEVTASSVSDPDSTPGNGSTSEDDRAQASFTVSGTRTAGTPPTFTCPAGTTLFDWDAITWTAGTTSNTYNIANLGNVSFSITNQGTWLNNATYGGQSPAEQSTVTGGIAGAGQSLFLYPDFATSSQVSVTTITLPQAVPGLQFNLFDVDYNAGQFADRIKVTGSRGGTPVAAILTNNLANYVIGDTAYGDQLSADTQANGNVLVTFTSAVDSIVIEYGNHSLSPADPGGQAVALHDITFCRPYADLSLAKTVSNASPVTGGAVSYTLTATSAAASTGTATGVTVQDTLPAGFTFVSASGTGTYNNSTGVWSVGSIAPGASAAITINGTVSASAGQTVTNVAQISASSLPDSDSTVNNGVTTEDDYASVAFTTGASTINCPVGSTATGSGFASSGVGTYLNQIFWLDWNCGATTAFNAGATVNKTWNAGDGLVITGTITGLTASVSPYTTGSWGGDQLDDRYSGVNPIGLRNTTDGQDPQFTLTLTATLDGVSVPLRYVAADAESTDGSNESLAATTNGTAWQLLEQQGVLTVNNSGTSFTLSDVANGGDGTAILETSGTSVAMNVTITAGGIQSMAFGVFTPFDYSDAPLTGTSYGSANHRTIGNYILGASVTSEAAAYDTPAANGDAADNGVVTVPTFLRGQTATVNVSVQGLGYLSSWIDFNDDGDWADSGEQVASDLRDGGTGDLDGAVNGNIRFQVAVPAGAALTPTIARLRYSSRAAAPTTGLWGFGEVEDYQMTIQNAELVVAKTSTIVSDPINGTINPKRLPGSIIRYCILVTNVGTVTADNVQSVDTLPSTVTYMPGTIRTGSTCASATTGEDDDASGGDESDPFGGSLSTTATDYVINGSAPSLMPGATFAVVFDVLLEPSPYPEAF